MFNLRKTAKDFSIYSIIFIGLFLTQMLYFNVNWNYEDVSVSANYYQFSGNLKQEYSTSNVISVVKPLDSNQEKFPVVILLHGDSSSSNFVSNLKRAFLRCDYMVVLMEVEYYDFEVFIQLNETLNHLLNRTDVLTDKIAIAGHSHGGHYATLFSTMRNESINAVACINFGSYEYWYDDYYDYYRYYIAENASLPSFYDEFNPEINMTLPMNLENPNNLLMISDDLDNRPEPYTPDHYFGNFTEGIYTERNTFYGNFDNGTARKLFVTKSIWGHGSGKFVPDSVYETIDWINAALGVDSSISSPMIVFEIYFALIITIISIIVGMFIISNLINLVIHYNVVKMRLLQIRSKKNSSHTENLEETIKKDLPGKNKSQLEGNQASEHLDMKKLSLYLLYAVLFVVVWEIFLRVLLNSSLHELYHWLKWFPRIILSDLGVYINSSLLNNSYPYDNMFVWAILMKILYNKIINQQKSQLRSLGDFTLKEFFSRILQALIIYVSFILMLEIPLNNLYGVLFPSIQIIDSILAIWVIYHLNLIIWHLDAGSNFNDRKSIIMSMGRNILIFMIPLFSDFIYYIGWSIIDWDFKSAVIYLIPMAIAAIFIGVINPLIKRKEGNILLISLLDYFLIVFLLGFFNLF